MAPKPHLCLTLFIPLLCYLSLNSCSPSAEKESDYEKWLSWNLEKYRDQSVLAAESIKQPRGAGGHGLDAKLKKAELNKVKITVSQDGSGEFTNITDALKSIPLHNTRRVIIEIKPGVYREKLVVPKALHFVTFFGDPSDPPMITGNDTASSSGRDGSPLKTYHSATVAVNADYFVAINIKFENTAPHAIGSNGDQAVALRISGNKSSFYNCSFFGDQDTLYDHKGFHYFNHCFIQGSVDFIFGYGRSLYENCHLNSIAKKVASLTAQKRTTSSMISGFSFKDCTVTGSGQVYLGRPWGEYSTVVFSSTFMDKLVLPQGWSDWGDANHHLKVYYGEYQCTGPGASGRRVPWARLLTDEEAKPFIGTYYVEGDNWLISP